MLDVHAPEHTPHSVRDFFLHIFTITIGLLIALGLEALVEYRHHMHLRHEADESILSEVRDNQRELAEVISRVPEEKQMLLKSLAFLKAHQEHKPYDLRDMNLGMSLGSYRDASYQTATTTGALGYMEYSHVKRYSAAYTLQSQFSQLQAQTLTAYLELQSFLAGNADPNQLSPEDTQRARIDVQRTLADLLAMEQIGDTLQKQYGEVLKSE